MAEKIGIDIGNSGKKYAWRGGVGIIPSFIGKGKLNEVTSGASNSMISIDGEDYIIGEDATLGRGFSFQTHEHKGKGTVLVYVLHILSLLKLTDVLIMVGLPVSTFVSECEKIKRLLSGIKQASIGGKLITFNIDTKVTMEPVGTYLSLICDPEGNINPTSPYYTKHMAIVDIGWSTLDIVSLRAGKLGERKNSELLGTSFLFDQVWKELEPDHGLVKSDEKLEIYKTIIKYPGSSLVAGGQHVKPEIWRRIDTWKRDLAKYIIEAVLNTLGDSKPPLMVFTGGGAIFLSEQLKKEYPALVIHDNPVYANAIGFYRGLLHMK